MKTPRLRIAIQKSGRLNNDSLDLLRKCGIKCRVNANTLYCHAENLPIDILFVRDDDIPTLINDEICDLAIVGENVLLEQSLLPSFTEGRNNIEVVKKLGFSRCHLAIAIPEDAHYENEVSLNGLRIATSYPNLLQAYLLKNDITAEILTISGSVEIAPKLGMADAICDLVSTGQTLEDNNLKEVVLVTNSQAVLIKTSILHGEVKQVTAELLFSRIDGVLKAQESKYIMFHAPKASLNTIKALLPGCESPTVIPLTDSDEKVVVHVVSVEGVFWSTIEKLKQAGASSILVLPIEKMLA